MTTSSRRVFPNFTAMFGNLDEDCNEPPGAKKRSVREVTDINGEHRWGSFEFQRSVWDAAMFLGAPQLGMFGSLHLLGLILLNILFQGTYLYIVTFNLTFSDYDHDLVGSLSSWRDVVGHHVKYHSNGGTLARRLCESDRSLETSSFQAAILEEIDKYYPRSGIPAGPMMCLLAIIMWTSTCTKELQLIWSQIRGLLVLPVVSSVRMVELEDGTWRLQGICRNRRRMFGLLVATRAVFCLVLIVVGQMFLVATVDLEDLLLNAVALEFVMNVDELLFEAFAPLATKQVVDRLEPLLYRAECTFRGLDSQAFCVTLSATIVVALSLTTLLLPDIQLVLDSRDALCKGELDFVYAESEFPPFQFWTNAPPHPGYQDNTDMVRALRQGEPYNVSVLNLRLPAVSGTDWSVLGISQWGPDEVEARFNQWCTDYDLAPDEVDRLDTISALSMKICQNITRCADAEPFCWGELSVHKSTRLICPETCGCTKPGHPRAYSSPSANGCPQGCREHPQYLSALEVGCLDQPLEALHSDPSWAGLADDYLVISSSWPPTAQADMRMLRHEMLRVGCSVIPLFRNITGWDICDEEDSGKPMKSLRFWCPATCGCVRGRLNCPLSCPV